MSRYSRTLIPPKFPKPLLGFGFSSFVVEELDEPEEPLPDDDVLGLVREERRLFAGAFLGVSTKVKLMSASAGMSSGVSKVVSRVS